MGVATAINFQPAGPSRVATTGDFVLLASEVNAVMRELRAGGIAVTALHTHMIGESPRVIFLHYWGKGRTVDLAKAVKSAIPAGDDSEEVANATKKTSPVAKS